MANKIIATEGGGDRFVVQTGDNRGYVIDIIRGMKTDEMSLDSISKVGYWQEYVGRLTPEDLDRRYEKNKRR